MSDPNSTLDRLVDRCGQLYSLPVVAMRVLQLTDSPTVDVRAIKECIENDPALTSKVLRVVNSSLFGLSREVTDLNQAIALLGINPLKLLVLGFSLPDDLFLGINGDILRRYWHRTLIKAVAAREISLTILRLPGDEAFIAGLLQDIGALVLLQELGESYARFLDCALSKAPSLGETERESLGFNHATLSAKLLERWALPKVLVTAVEAGQSRERILALPPIDRALPQVLLLADLLGGLLAENRTDLLAELLDRGREYLGLTHTQLTSLVSALSAKVDHLAEVLQLELPQGKDYQAILVEAHAKLSVVAGQAAEQLLRGGAGAKAPEKDQELLGEVRQLADEMARTADSLTKTAPSRDTISLGPGGLKALLGSAAVPSAHARAASTSRERDTVDRTADRGAPVAVVDPPRPATSRGDVAYDPGLAGRVAAAVATCRQARHSLSLLVVEIDRYDELVLACGVAAAERMVQQVGVECRRVDHHGAIVVQSRDVQFAVILPDCDRRQAVDVSNGLVGGLRQTSSQAGGDQATPLVSVSVGVASVALPPKNFPAAELIRAAERCLNGARLSGGNAVKSIEIY